jgi:hypothetical protein
MFIQLHGNLPVANIRKRHALEFREALQQVPKIRSGPLLKAALPELSQWGREHPSEPKVSAGTINKQLGAVQAIAGWGYRKGLVPDDVPWSDPFKDMRLEEEQSGRGSFDPRELQRVFDAPIFTGAKMPVGGREAAGFWLPVLALFSGARQGEIAGLQVKNVRLAAQCESLRCQAKDCPVRRLQSIGIATKSGSGRPIRRCNSWQRTTNINPNHQCHPRSGNRWVGFWTGRFGTHPNLDAT